MPARGFRSFKTTETSSDAGKGLARPRGEGVKGEQQAGKPLKRRLALIPGNVILFGST